MYQKAALFTIRTISPLHAGSGDTLGFVDQPIQRERHTGFPKIEASSLKGALRESFENKNEENKFKQKIELTFGPEDGDSHAGALGFTDARLLLFPVKSVRGVFAWITCPVVLKRFQEDMELCDQNSNSSANIKLTDISDGHALITNNSINKIENIDKIVLEEYTFTASKSNENIAIMLNKYTNIGDELKKRLVVLSDNDFRDFVELSTEVITRIKIDNATGTAASGALFTEEYLPAESILYALALATNVFNNQNGLTDFNEADHVIKFFIDEKKEIMQIGGNATLGKGIVQLYCKDNPSTDPKNAEHNK